MNRLESIDALPLSPSHLPVGATSPSSVAVATAEDGPVAILSSRPGAGLLQERGGNGWQ